MIAVGVVLIVVTFASITAHCQTTPHSVDLKWDAQAQPVNAYRGTTAGGESATALNPAPLTGTTFTDTTVAPGTTYFYILRTVAGTVLSNPSNEVKAIIPPNAVVLTPSAVGLTWNALAGVTGYNVYRSLTSGSYGAPLNGATPVTGTTYQDKTATLGLTYFYVVRSVQSGVESAASNEVKAVTLPPTPSGLTCTIDGKPCP